MSFLINNERTTNVLYTPALKNLVKDISDAFEAQFIYLENQHVQDNPTVKDAYTAAIKDAVVATAGALCKNIGDFDVDYFYAACRYPGTHPIHKVGDNPFIQRTNEAEVTALDIVRNRINGNQQS